jgi:7-cyano-7-deazaguanine reductase
VPRNLNRQELGCADSQPFHGEDVWHAYELSWLNSKGKPVVALAEFFIPAQSPNLIESKSFKLYLNTFNQTKFDSLQEVQNRLESDLSAATGADVHVTVVYLHQAGRSADIGEFDAVCIDELDVSIEHYSTQPNMLKADLNTLVSEKLVSHLLKSNCLVTGQPDWGSVIIDYTGAKIDHESLLKYLISFRQHNEFHEQCVERIFTDLMANCQCESLTVYARYTRRGGLDINPFRTNVEGTQPENVRLVRQ